VEVSVVIPAYNEELRIGSTINKIVEFFESQGDTYQYEVVVVDDGSTDTTAKIVNGFAGNCVNLLCNPENRGKGYSVRRGVLEAKYPLILITDSDLSTPIRELENFIRYSEDGFDLVIGSRNLQSAKDKIERSLFRTWVGKGFNVLVSLIALKGFKDTQCGFKLGTRDSLQRIAKLQKLDGFAFDVEILYLARKFGFKTKEVPVTWVEDKKSTVHPLKDGFRMLRDLVKIKYSDKAGRYRE
jgi:dolichyl-phosphate beta-glucosyltransferase